MRHARIILSAVALLTIAGCSSSNKAVDTTPDRPVEELYNEAAAALDSKQYGQAAKLFDDVERQHPYSQWATQAQLMAAYASYKNQRYDEAILALDRFIELHPGSKDIDYAYYLRALSFYEQISDVRRDQEMTQLALQSLDTLIRLYPSSKYSRDATLKRDLTMDHLAGKEMEIGRYYINRGHINAAINRFLSVIKQYETTTHTAEALHRLVEAYLTLGLKEQATRVASVLGYNYPGSKWYERSFKLLDDKQRQRILDERGFMDRTIESIFKPE